jgi:hypothetical protein
MAASRQVCGTALAERLVDARRHFLGLLKGGELLIYCRRCKKFLTVAVTKFRHSGAPGAAER